MSVASKHGVILRTSDRRRRGNGSVIGLRYQTIADQLGVSVKTVEAHRGRLMDRLAIRDIAGLVRWAISHHLVTPEG